LSQYDVTVVRAALRDEIPTMSARTAARATAREWQLSVWKVADAA
jgi:hypothetical protein